MITKDILDNFCDTHSYEKIKIPWSNGDFTFATDGNIIIRIPRHPDIPKIKNPVDAEVIFREASPLPTRWVTLPDCKECHGRGYHILKNEYNSYEIECKTCDNSGIDISQQIESNNIKVISVGSIKFQTKYLALIKKLPDGVISPNNDGNPMKPSWFKCNGGDGLIMGVII